MKFLSPPSFPGTSAQIVLADGAYVTSLPVSILGLSYNDATELVPDATGEMSLFLTDGTNYGLKKLKDLPITVDTSNKVTKLSDTGVGIIRSKLHVWPSLGGTTVDVSTGSSNFQNGDLNSGTFTLKAPSTAHAASYVLRVYYSAGTLNATGFNRVDGELSAGQNFLYITVNAVVTLVITPASA